MVKVERPSTETLTVCPVTTDQPAPPSWIDEMGEYIDTGTLPDDQESTAKWKKRALSYERIDGRLYKRLFGGPLLRCLLPDQAREVMDEVHNGICSTHQGANTLSKKIIIQGYYWPSMVADYIA